MWKVWIKKDNFTLCYLCCVCKMAAALYCDYGSSLFTKTRSKTVFYIYRQMFEYFFTSHVKGLLRCIGNYYVLFIYVPVSCHLYIALSNVQGSHKRFTLIFFEILRHVYLFLPNVHLFLPLFISTKTSVHLFSRRSGSGSTELGLFPGLSFLRLELP